MTREDIRDWIKKEAEVKYSRASGPGGQNVNKVSTKATLVIPLTKLPLSDNDLGRLSEKLKGRINNRGELVISSDSTRSQLQNRNSAAARAETLIITALQKQKKRRRTKPGKSAVDKRISDKKHRSEKKKNRRIDF